MIWFACKQCGKTHHRPEEAAGTLVFCSCGQGNRVPWESTVPAEALPPQPPPRASPAPSWSQRRRPRDEDDEDEDDDGDESGPRRERPPGKHRRDPAVCFNHEDAPSMKTCAACGEAFCDRCVVTLRDRLLCGPCKNFQLRSGQGPREPSVLAIIALLVGLISGPCAFCFASTFQSSDKTGPFAPSFFGLLGVSASITAIVMGYLAVRAVESKPRLGGRAIAITGMTTAAIGLVWSLSIIAIAALRQAGIQ